jgi:N-methylhydantoinase B
MKRGDRLSISYAGGGGYGPPEKRDRAKVAADLEDGLISADAARAIYRFSPERKR